MNVVARRARSEALDAAAGLRVQAGVDEVHLPVRLFAVVDRRAARAQDRSVMSLFSA